MTLLILKKKSNFSMERNRNRNRNRNNHHFEGLWIGVRWLLKKICKMGVSSFQFNELSISDKRTAEKSPFLLRFSENAKL